MKIWENTDSFLLDSATREKVKEAKGCLVAKSLQKEKDISSITWRLSINSAPLMEKAVNHFGQLDPPCNVKKILRLIKDIKQVALTGKDKDFLKSYNVKQALLWSIHEYPGISSESDLLTLTLKKLIQFYEENNLPSFLEPKRNLLFKMNNLNEYEAAGKSVIEILRNVETWIGIVKERQGRNFAGILDVRENLAPMANILMFPIVSENIAERVTKSLNKTFNTADGKQRFFFEDSNMVDIRDKGRDKVLQVTEQQALKCIIRDWVISILTYVTDKDAKNDEIIEDEEEDIPSVKTSAIEDFVNSLSEVLPRNKRNRGKINEAVGILTSLAETVPMVHEVLPAVTDVFKSTGNLLKLIRD